MQAGTHPPPRRTIVTATTTYIFAHLKKFEYCKKLLYFLSAILK